MTDRANTIAAKIEAFIRADVIPYEKDPRTGPHGPSDELEQIPLNPSRIRHGRRSLNIRQV